MFNSALCSILGHKIDRSRVWHDGINFRTRCHRCKTPMIRELDGWSQFETEVHGSVDRSSHPHNHA